MPIGRPGAHSPASLGFAYAGRVDNQRYNANHSYLGDPIGSSVPVCGWGFRHKRPASRNCLCSIPRSKRMRRAAGVFAAVTVTA